MTAADTQIDALINRVTRLERQNHQLRVLVGAAALLTLGMLVFGQPNSGQAFQDGEKVVEANRFVLRDTGGKKRAELSLSKEFKDAPSRVSLILFDAKEKSVATVQESRGSTGRLSLNGPEGAQKGIQLSAEH